MERPLLTSIFMVFGMVECIFPLLVESLLEENHFNLFSPSLILSLPPPTSPPPLQPPPTTPPTTPPHRLVLNRSLNHTRESSHCPPPSSPPPISPHASKKNTTEKAPHPQYGHQLDHRDNRFPQIKKIPNRKINPGKKIGLSFAGIAGILQFAVIGFLGFKRWQFSKRDRHDNCSS